MIDAGFNKFLTLKIIKIVWVACVVLGVLFAVAAVTYGIIGRPGELTFTAEGETIEGERQTSWLVIFVSPVLAALWLLFVRIALELVAVIFRIAENTTALARAVPPTEMSPRTSQDSGAYAPGASQPDYAPPPA
jgi:hypothetical protein